MQAILVADRASTRRTAAGLNSTWNFTSFATVSSVASPSRMQHAPRFLQRVEIRVVAVPLVRQHLHRRVLEIAGADAEDREEHAGVALALDEVRRDRADSTMPTLKSPSVARMTRLTPPGTNAWRAMRYAMMRPCAAVGRAAGVRARRSRAESRRARAPASATARRRSCPRRSRSTRRSSARSVSTNMPSAVLMSGSRRRGCHRSRHVDQQHDVACPDSRSLARAARAPISTSLCAAPTGSRRLRS